MAYDFTTVKQDTTFSSGKTSDDSCVDEDFEVPITIGFQSRLRHCLGKKRVLFGIIVAIALAIIIALNFTIIQKQQIKKGGAEDSIVAPDDTQVSSTSKPDSSADTDDTEVPTRAPSPDNGENSVSSKSPTPGETSEQREDDTEVPTLSPTTSPPSSSANFQPILINAGGEEKEYNDTRGHIWLPDTAFTSSAGSAYTNCNNRIFDAAIDDFIYCTGRSFEGNGMYEIPVPDDSYAITLHFAETFLEGLDRVFDILVEGFPVLPYLNVLKKANAAFTAYTIDTVSAVVDGRLTIELNAVLLDPIISAIEIHKADLYTSTVPQATYVPGNLIVQQHGLILSEGLSTRILATSKKPVLYDNGNSSAIDFHVRPDAGACFEDTRDWNPGGWIYVSNSEAKERKPPKGGVGAFTFNASGHLLDYRMVLNGTRKNCGGGKTPWGAWISGEEFPKGKIWQTDPFGVRSAERITMGENHSGFFESFAYDVRNIDKPRFFMTKDRIDVGDVRRFTPVNPDWDNPWTILTGNGTIEYLVVDAEGDDSGTFEWTTNHKKGIRSGRRHYPNVEGIDQRGGILYFVSKLYKSMFTLDLDTGTYSNTTTKGGMMDGQPDQLIRLIGDRDSVSDDILYFTEEGGKYAGIHGRNLAGQYLTMLESHELSDETTGLAFSPNGMHMYIAYQESGLLFDVTRTDGLPFHAKTLDVKYHSTGSKRRNDGK